MSICGFNQGRAERTARRTSPSARATQRQFELVLLNQIPVGGPISCFKNGDFIDPCAGPHVLRAGNIGAFKLHAQSVDGW